MSVNELRVLAQQFADAFGQRDFKPVTERDGIAPKIDKVFLLSRIEDAYHDLNSNSQIGKIVVVP